MGNHRGLRGQHVFLGVGNRNLHPNPNHNVPLRHVHPQDIDPRLLPHLEPRVHPEWDWNRFNPEHELQRRDNAAPAVKAPDAKPDPARNKKPKEQAPLQGLRFRTPKNRRTNRQKKAPDSESDVEEPPRLAMRNNTVHGPPAQELQDKSAAQHAIVRNNALGRAADNSLLDPWLRAQENRLVAQADGYLTQEQRNMLIQITQAPPSLEQDQASERLRARYPLHGLAVREVQLAARRQHLQQNLEHRRLAVAAQQGLAVQKPLAAQQAAQKAFTNQQVVQQAAQQELVRQEEVTIQQERIPQNDLAIHLQQRRVAQEVTAVQQLPQNVLQQAHLRRDLLVEQGQGRAVQQELLRAQQERMRRDVLVQRGQGPVNERERLQQQQQVRQQLNQELAIGQERFRQNHLVEDENQRTNQREQFVRAMPGGASQREGKKGKQQDPAEASGDQRSLWPQTLEARQDLAAGQALTDKSKQIQAGALPQSNNQGGNKLNANFAHLMLQNIQQSRVLFGRGGLYGLEQNPHIAQQIGAVFDFPHEHGVAPVRDPDQQERQRQIFTPRQPNTILNTPVLGPAAPIPAPLASHVRRVDNQAPPEVEIDFEELNAIYSVPENEANNEDNGAEGEL
jgi:hypothetical protein